jgi:hypothetical protein
MFGSDRCTDTGEGPETGATSIGNTELLRAPGRVGGSLAETFRLVLPLARGMACEYRTT